jgi:hypothetical protein
MSLVCMAIVAFAASLLIERNLAQAKLAAVLSLYDPPSGAESDCENPNGFCARINGIRAGLSTYKVDSVAPICPGTQYRRAMEQVVDLHRTDCASYPAVTTVTTPVSQLSKSAGAMYRGILPLLNDPQTVSIARLQLQQFAQQNPNTSGIFDDLGRAYQADRKIADPRRFSEAGACYIRALDLACADPNQVPDLYDVGYGLSGFFEQYKLWSQNFLVLAGLSSSLLADEAIASKTKESPHSPLIIERLWRGARASVDAARTITKENGCVPDIFAKGVAISEACESAKGWYARGVDAFASMLKIAAVEHLSSDERARVNDGVGVAALYWGQDPIFRTVANGAISPQQMIAELQIASEAKLLPRYFADLAMIYCLVGDFPNAKSSAEKILSKDQKDIAIKEKAGQCATTPDPGSLFTIWTDIGG